MAQCKVVKITLRSKRGAPGGRPEVKSAEVVLRAPSVVLRSPLIASTAGWIPGDQELVVERRDAKGRKVEEWGMPATVPEWAQRPEDKGVHGPAVRRGQGQHDWLSPRVPCPDPEVPGFFVVKRHRIGRVRTAAGTTRLTLVKEVLGVVALDRRAPVPASLRRPGCTPVVVKSLARRRAPAPPTSRPGCRLLPPIRIGPDRGRAAFNIAVSGEAFSRRGMRAFSTAARSLVWGLQRMKPFCHLGPRINWYVVRAISPQGTFRTSPPWAARPRTFFELRATEGSFGPTFRTPRSRLVEQAITLGGGRRADLLIILVNCPDYGGRAWARLGTAVLTLEYFDRAVKERVHKFHYAAAHECGHAIANLAEEWTGAGEDPIDHRSNQATLGQVGASVKQHLWQTRKDLRSHLRAWEASDSIWWSGLAPRAHVDSRNRFTYTHVPGDPAKPDSFDPLPQNLYSRKVGAFWGCGTELGRKRLLARIGRVLAGVPRGSKQTLVDALLGRVDPKTPIERGGYFYRASAYCCMKSADRPFCAACCHIIANHIRHACGLKVRPPACGP